VFRAVQDEDSGVGNFYTIRPDGSRLTQITHFKNTKISHVVSFSPDGKWITSSSGPVDGLEDVFVARADGTQLRVIARTPATEETGPKWGPAS
jgi:Tol biopolymer transport system component